MRRSEKLFDVPLSVSAFDQDTLDRRSIRNISDLSRITPGVTLTPGWAGSTNIAIRGISSTIGAGTTGIYLDDTPVQVRFVGAGSTSTNAYPAIFDLDRVEVLRGPQGTLFGAGSMGGTIRFITPQPSLTDYSGYGRAELAFTDGGAPSNEAGVAFGGPLVRDRVGFRISAYRRFDGGWVDRANYATGAVVDRNSNSKESIALRAALKIAVTDRLTLTPAIFYQDVRLHDADRYWVNLSNPDAGQYRNGQPLRQPWRDRFTLYSLGGEYDLGWATLISNTSWFDRRNPSIADYSTYVAELLGRPYDAPLAIGFAAPVEMRNGQKVFTQEVRLQSQGDGRWTWLVGAFYRNAEQSAYEAIHTPDLDALSLAFYHVPAIYVFGQPLLAPDIGYLGRDKTHDRQLALFGQVDYRITQTLTATAGLRVARTHFDFTNAQSGPLNGAPSGASGKQSETPVTPRFSVQYKPDEDDMFYVSAAKGFRTGGANSPVPASRCALDLGALGLTKAPDSYNSDTLWSYEAGAKSRVLNRRLELDASVFYIDWSNIQSAVSLSNCGFGYIANLGSAVSKGFDLHATARPLDGLTLELGLGYTDARYSETVLGAPLAGGAQRIIVSDGDRLRTAPWHVSVAADYAVPVDLGPDALAYVHAAYDFNNSYGLRNVADYAYDPLQNRIFESSFASARLGLRRGDLDMSVFVDNLFNSTDQMAYTHSTRISALFRALSFRPRTVGLTLSYRD